MLKRNVIKISKNEIKTKVGGGGDGEREEWKKEKERKKQTERREGRGTIINTRKSCSIIPLYILDTPLHSFLSKKKNNRLNYYKIQDYQCTAFNNNVQGSLSLSLALLFISVVIL